jgi:hypothetical protein
VKARPPFSIVVDVVVPIALWMGSGWAMLLLYLLVTVHTWE